MMKVLFLDTVHPILQQKLEASGIACDHCLEKGKDEVEGIIDVYDGVVVRGRIPIDGELLGKADRLKFIARSGAGLEKIDQDRCEELGIKIFNAPEGNRDAVGEHATGMLLALFNTLCKGDREVRNGIWDREGNRGIELGERTVGLIGYGNTGKAFAQKIQGFGCRVLAYDKYRQGYANKVVEESSLEQIQREADVIGFHVPLSEETYHYFDPSFLDRMEHPFYLLNTSRGNVVDTEAVLEGLRSEKLLGACFDVLEFEKGSFEGLEASELPPAYRELFAHERVMLSPHVAGWTDASYRRLSGVLAEKILRWKEGRGGG